MHAAVAQAVDDDEEGSLRRAWLACGGFTAAGFADGTGALAMVITTCP